MNKQFYWIVLLCTVSLYAGNTGSRLKTESGTFLLATLRSDRLIEVSGGALNVLNSQTGNILAISCWDDTVRSGWDDMVPLALLVKAHTTIITASHYGKIKEWDPGTQWLIRDYCGSKPGSWGSVRVLAAVNADAFISGADDGVIKRHDSRSPCDALSLSEDSYPVLSLAVSKYMLSSGAVDGTVKIWDLRKHGTPRQVLKGCDSPVVSLVSDGTVFHSASSNGVVRSWNPVTGVLTREVTLSLKKSSLLTGMVKVRGAVAIAAGCEVEVLYDEKTCGRHDSRSLSGHSRQVLALASSSDGEDVFSKAADGTLRTGNARDNSLTPLPEYKG